MITATNHISITVKDLGKMVAFFRDVLGLTNVWPEYSYQGNVVDTITGFNEAHLKVVKIQAPNIIIEFIEYLSPSGRELKPATNDIGCPHIAFEVDDIEEAYERLSKQQVQFKSPPVLISDDSNPMKGWKAVYFSGPEHLNFEFMQRPKPSKP